MNDDLVEDFLHELEGWERAYPLSMFPEPDLAKAAKLLKAGGMTLDAISASNMRHVVSQIAPKARAAISAIEGEGWQPIDSAPKDGTPLILFARCKTATAPAPVIGWHHPELGWIESCFTPNRPVGLVPTHWMPRPGFPGEKM